MKATIYRNEYSSSLFEWQVAHRLPKFKMILKRFCTNIRFSRCHQLSRKQVNLHPPSGISPSSTVFILLLGFLLHSSTLMSYG